MGSVHASVYMRERVCVCELTHRFCREGVACDERGRRHTLRPLGLSSFTSSSSSSGISVTFSSFSAALLLLPGVAGEEEGPAEAGEGAAGAGAGAGADAGVEAGAGAGTGAGLAYMGARRGCMHEAQISSCMGRPLHGRRTWGAGAAGLPRNPALTAAVSPAACKEQTRAIGSWQGRRGWRSTCAPP